MGTRHRENKQKGDEKDKKYVALQALLIASCIYLGYLNATTLIKINDALGELTNIEKRMDYEPPESLTVGQTYMKLRKA